MVPVKLPIPFPNFNISHFQSATLSHLWIQASCYVNLSNPNFVLLAFKVLYIHLQGNRNSRWDQEKAIQAPFILVDNPQNKPTKSFSLCCMFLTFGFFPIINIHTPWASPFLILSILSVCTHLFSFNTFWESVEYPGMLSSMQVSCI